MADNYITQPGAGGVTFRSDEDGGLIHWPVIKLSWGGDGTFNFVESGTPLPVSAVQSGAWAVSVSNFPAVQPVSDNGGSLTVDGVFFQATQPISAAALPLPAGAATAALQTQPGVDIGDVTINNAAGGAAVNIQDGGNSITVDGTVAVSGTITVDSELPAAAALADNTANPTVPGVGAFLMGWDTATWDRVQVAAAGALKVDSSHVTQPVSGTVAISTALLLDATFTGRINTLGQKTMAASTPVVLASDQAAIPVTATLVAGGDVDVLTLPGSAHDSAIAGNPVRIAGRAMSADYAAVSTGETADLLASLLGKQIVLPYGLPGATESYASPAAVTDTADDEAFAAGAGGVRHYITGIQVFNGHDTVGTEVVIKDGATVKWRGWAEEKGGGCSAKFDPPLRGTAATAVNVANITTSSSTYFNLQGYQAAE